jgi:hypothetical protein
MTSHQLKTRFRFGMAMLAGGIALAGAGSATAQTGYSAPIYQEDSGTALSRHLKTLANLPRNVGALTGAAKAALELGDAQAAATFYARAEESRRATGASRRPRLRVHRHGAAAGGAQIFEDARSLGAPRASMPPIAASPIPARHPAQAQRDYATACAQDNDELRLRMAYVEGRSADRAGRRRRDRCAAAAGPRRLARIEPSCWR